MQSAKGQLGIRCGRHHKNLHLLGHRHLGCGVEVGFWVVFCAKLGRKGEFLVATVGWCLGEHLRVTTLRLLMLIEACEMN